MIITSRSPFEEMPIALMPVSDARSVGIGISVVVNGEVVLKMNCSVAVEIGDGSIAGGIGENKQVRFKPFVQCNLAGLSLPGSDSRL